MSRHSSSSSSHPYHDSRERRRLEPAAPTSYNQHRYPPGYSQYHHQPEQQQPQQQAPIDLTAAVAALVQQQLHTAMNSLRSELSATCQSVVDSRIGSALMPMHVKIAAATSMGDGATLPAAIAQAQQRLTEQERIIHEQKAQISHLTSRIEQLESRPAHSNDSSGLTKRVGRLEDVVNEHHVHLVRLTDSADVKEWELQTDKAWAAAEQHPPAIASTEPLSDPAGGYSPTADFS